MRVTPLVTAVRQAPIIGLMQRSVWARVIALFVGLWFVAMAAGPEMTHACPMHGSHDTAATTGGHAEHHGSTDADSDSSNQCTCLGQCCSAGPVAIVAQSIALVDVTTSVLRDTGLPDYAYVPAAAQHVLPLANAPPLSA
jgi:hypothetical protein